MGAKRKYEFAVPFRDIAEYLKRHRHILHLTDEAIKELVDDLKPYAKLCEVDIEDKLREDGIIQ